MDGGAAACKAFPHALGLSAVRKTYGKADFCLLVLSAQRKIADFKKIDPASYVFFDSQFHLFASHVLTTTCVFPPPASDMPYICFSS